MVLGDLSRPHFGLSDQEWDRLCSTITVIYHAGAWVNGLFDYATLKEANVMGTVEVLRLASYSLKVKPLHYVSTISVVPDRKNAKELPLDSQSEPSRCVVAHSSFQ